MDDNRLGRAMASALAKLLDPVPASRRVLPHLAVLEQLLVSEGVDGLETMPLVLLEKAHSQLSKLPLPPENAMLPQLKSLLDLAVQARHLRRLPPPGPEGFLSSFMTDEKLTVDEVSHTEFARAVELQERRAQV